MARQQMSHVPSGSGRRPWPVLTSIFSSVAAPEAGASDDWFLRSDFCARPTGRRCPGSPGLPAVTAGPPVPAPPGPPSAAYRQEVSLYAAMPVMARSTAARSSTRCTRGWAAMPNCSAPGERQDDARRNLGQDHRPLGPSRR